MCKSPFHGFLKALPKCEHHMHLEGSLSPELLFSLAQQNAITLPQDDTAFQSVEALYARYDRFTSLDDFLAYYYIGFSVLINAADFEALAFAYFTKAHSQGVRHAEVFFDPQVHIGRGIAYTTIVDGFVAAQKKAEAQFGVTSMLIPCLLRHLPVPDSLATFKAIQEHGHFENGTLAGLGLCSTEIEKPPVMWKEIFDLAREAGIRRTAHAGEEGPAEYVSGALDDLGALRIDHGVNSRHSEDVMERLAREGVMLSVCPISNVVLKGVPAVKDVPIRTFLDKGVRFSINSDDPAYFGGYILENYCAVHDAFDLSIDEWERIATHAIEGSWCGPDRKAAVLSEIKEVVSEWKGKLSV